MHIFQIPSSGNESQDYTIGVVDCSGSMEGNWEWLADHWNRFIGLESSKIITFDTVAKIPADNRMNKDISRHGGGGTNITAGFVKLDAELKLLPKNSNVTVVFISDGEDNNLNTLPARMSELEGNDGSRRVNFICIGVGPGFPTFISMKLREKYHNGDETLPAIFLIEHISEKAYTIKFEAIKPFLTVGRQRLVKPAVCVFPWRENTDHPFERAWVMTDAESIELDGQKMDVKEHYLNIRGINELFRSWNQMINLESLNEGEKVDARAKKTLALMDSILEELKEVRGIDVFAKAKDLKFDDLFSKFQFIVNKRNFERTVWYYEDVKKIATGSGAGQLSSFEAAKRIGLGTIVGRQAQKAFALKKINPAKLEEIKAEFKQLLKDHPVAKKDNPHPFRSILLEANLDKALDLIKNQLELFETFPLHGHPCRVNRNDKGEIDPQNVDLRFLGTHVNIELTDVTGEQGGTVNVPLKDGKSETANAVIPLFGEDDKDLAPFINSQFYKLLLSFSLIRDPDELLDQSFLCMLVAAFEYAMKQDPFDPALANIVVTNLELIRSNIAEGDLFAAKPADTIEGLTTELDIEKKPKSATASKALMNAYGHLKSGRITKELFEKLVKFLLAKELKGALSGSPAKLGQLFSTVVQKKDDEESLETKVAKKIRETFAKIRSFGALGRSLGHEILAQTANSEFDLVFVPSRGEKLLDSTLGYALFKNLSAATGIALPDATGLERLILVAYAATKDEFDFDNEEAIAGAKLKAKVAIKDSLQGELSKGKDGKGKEAKGKDKKGKKKGEVSAKKERKAKDMTHNHVYKALYPVLEKEFQAHFKLVHQEVIPIPKAEIEEYCKTHGINFKSIQFCANSHLPVRTCAAPKCNFFMRKMDRLDSHLGVWGVALPKGFHMMVRENRKKDVKEIYEIFEKAHFTVVDGKNVPFDPTKFGKTKEEVLQYIERLRDAYVKIDG